METYRKRRTPDGGGVGQTNNNNNSNNNNWNKKVVSCVWSILWFVIVVVVINHSSTCINNFVVVVVATTVTNTIGRNSNTYEVSSSHSPSSSSSLMNHNNNNNINNIEYQNNNNNNNNDDDRLVMKPTLSKQEQQQQQHPVLTTMFHTVTDIFSTTTTNTTTVDNANQSISSSRLLQKQQQQEPLPLKIQPIRVNVGSSESILSSSGAYWKADYKNKVDGIVSYYESNTTRVTSYNATECQKIYPNIRPEKYQIYCTSRIFPQNKLQQHTYRVPMIGSGLYQIQLYFIENKYNTTNQRVFNVSIYQAGTKLKDNILYHHTHNPIDIYKKAKGMNRSYKLTQVVDIKPVLSSSPSIIIKFTNIIGDALLNAVAILPNRKQPPAVVPVALSPTIRTTSQSPQQVLDVKTPPSKPPTFSPTDTPTLSPITNYPTLKPTISPTDTPTSQPTLKPTISPTDTPTSQPTLKPTVSPTDTPTSQPTLKPTVSPTLKPTFSPTLKPITNRPTQSPTIKPITNRPTILTDDDDRNTFREIRINAGYSERYIDKDGLEWLPDQYYTGGLTWSNIIPISNTRNPVLYQYDRSGESFSYDIQVPVGEYEIQFIFAELIYKQIGERVFDIIVEDIIYTGIDILALSNKQVATASDYYVVSVVDDGELNILFRRSMTTDDNGDIFRSNSENTSTTVQGDPKVSGIVIKTNAVHLAHAVAAGPYYGTIIDPKETQGLVQLNGLTSHTHGVGLQITDVTWTEGNKVLGDTFLVDYEFSVGKHNVELTIQDNGKNIGTEKTTVTIREYGFPAITNITPINGLCENLNSQSNELITITGSGYDRKNLSVQFGTITIQSTDIDILSSTMLQFRCPYTAVPAPISVTVTTDMGVSSPPGSFEYIATVPIKWDMEIVMSSITGPTVGRFGPDHKLYVGTTDGRLYKIAMDSQFKTVTNVISKRYDASPTYAILGLALDPMDAKPDPDVYFNYQLFFHKGTMSTSGNGINGRIMKASGPSLETIEEIITGLPVSDLDHGLNALEFGDNGELFFGVGGNTNAGLPGPLSSSRLLKENFLSSSIVVAYLSHPNFDGVIRYTAPDDGDMIASGIDVYASGTRNPYGMVIHSNGEMYATDNGPNKGYGKTSTGCGPNDFTDEVVGSDEVNRIMKGHYYGHPNRNRAKKLKEPHQCIRYSQRAVSSSTHTAPLVELRSSHDGIIEFHGNHFGGELRYNLIVTKYKAAPSLTRIILNKTGTAPIAASREGLPMNTGSQGVDITQAPNGNIIEMRYPADSLGVIIPSEPRTTSMIVKTVFPRRGTNAGGNKLSVYGVNFSKTMIVTVGGKDCPVVTFTKERMDCTLPGGKGTVDIIVSGMNKDGVMEKSTFEQGYRYITGLLPRDFVLPVYD